MLSTLSVFISRPPVVILNKVLSVDELCVNSRPPIRRHSQRMYKEVTYIKMRKIQDSKNKTSLYYNKGTITISSVIPYISETNSTSSSLKKTLKKERGKENEMEKRRRRKKGRKEFVRHQE